MTEEERKERQREYRRRYYAAHKEECDERTRRWKEAHADECREYNREYQSLWRNANPDKTKTYHTNMCIHNLKRLGYTIMKDGVEV